MKFTKENIKICQTEAKYKRFKTTLNVQRQQKHPSNADYL